MTEEMSLQERYAPQNACFGCGPANKRGLKIRSFPTGRSPDSEVVATWTPQPHHAAFENVLNGGIIGTLLDCHGNWTAIWHLICRDGLERAPCSVTADFHVEMKRPTPVAGPLRVSARVVESDGPRVTVEASIEAGTKVTAICLGHFVAVEPGHPAFNRW